jgi:carbonyl reductase 1
VNALTRILAKDHPGLIINACCPGWVKTDMGVQIGRAPKTPEDGAKIPVRLAFGDIGGVTGRYWANSSVRSREEGEVQEW